MVGRNFGGDAHRLGDTQLLLAIETRAQRLSGDVRHYIEEIAVGFARVVQRENVRVLQVRGGLDLGEKALGADRLIVPSVGDRGG